MRLPSFSRQRSLGAKAPRWLRGLVALVLLALAGLALTACPFPPDGGDNTVTPIPPDKSEAQYYTYSDGACQPQDYSDPVTVKLVHGATSQAVLSEGDAYGWDNHLGSNTHFFVNGCQDMTDQIATNTDPLPITPDRFHMRFESAFSTTDGDYTLVSPHHENVDRCAWHSVDETTDTRPGGYVDGTQEFLTDWTGPGRGKLIGAVYVGNKGPVEQCWWVFSYWAAGDGWLYIIDVKP